MAKDWEEYEKVTATVYQALGQSIGIEVMCHGRDCSLMGRSGVRHQIDVLTSHGDGVHAYRTAIECKYWNRKVDKAVVAKHASTVEDTGVEKGVVVSKSGFTRDATRLAKQLNVSLVELRKPLDSDWRGYIRNLVLRLNVFDKKTYDYQFVLPNVQENRDVIPGMYSALNSDVILSMPDGKKESLWDIENRETVVTADWKEGDEREFVIRFDAGTTLSVVDSDVNAIISEIRFKARLHVVSEEMRIPVEDQVALLMKAIFEDEEFVISPDGRVTRRSPRTWV